MTETTPRFSDIAERLFTLAIITILAVMILRTLTRIEEQNDAKAARQNATLDAIQKQMDPEEWLKAKPLLENLK